MANVFNFGIGLTVADEATSQINTAFTTYGQQAQSLANTFSDISERLSLSKFVQEDALALTDQTSKIAAQMGLAESAASEMNERIIEMSALTGRNTKTFTALANALGEAGLRLGDFTDAQQVSAAAGQANQVIWGEQEALAGLIDAFGVAAEETAQFAKGSRLLNIDLQGSLDRMTQLQQVVPGVTGLVAQMPAVIEGAREALADFGEEITGNGPKMVEAISRTGAAFAKALGRTAAEAVRSAVSSFQRFSSELDSNRRLLLGLSDGISPAMDALFEFGFAFDEANEALRKGQQDPVAFAASIKQMADQMAQTPGGALQAERAMLKLMDSMRGTPIPELLRNQEALNKALQANAEINTATGAATGKFQETVERMWKTAAVARQVFENLVKLGKVTIGVFAAPILRDIFGDVGDSLKNVNDRVRVFTERLAKSKEFQEKIRPSLVVVGKIMLGVSAAAGALASALGTLAAASFGVKALAQSSNMLLKPMKMLTGISGDAPIFRMPAMFTSLGKAARFVGKKLLLPLTIIGSIKTSLVEFGQTMSDPSLLSGDKFVGIVSGIVKTAADVFDKLLFGIPTKLMNTFFPQMKGSFRDGVGSIVESFMSGFRGMDLREVFSDLTSRAIKGAVGLGKSLVGTVKEFFTSGAAKEMFFDIAIGFQQLGYALIEIAGDIATGILEGILGEVGSSLPELGAIFANTWLNLKAGWLKFTHFFVDSWYGIREFFAEPLMFIEKALESTLDFTASGVEYLGAKIKSFFNDSVTFVSDAFDSLGSSLGEVWDNIARGATIAAFEASKGIIDGVNNMLGQLSTIAQLLPGTSGIQDLLKSAREGLSSISKGIEQAKQQEVAQHQKRVAQLAIEKAAAEAPLIARKKLIADTLASEVAASQTRRAEAQSASEAMRKSNLESIRQERAENQRAHEAALADIASQISANNRMAEVGNQQLQQKRKEEEIQRNLVETAKERKAQEEAINAAAEKGNKTLAEKCREMSDRQSRMADLAKKFAGTTNFGTMAGIKSIGAFGGPVAVAAPTTPRPAARIEPQPAEIPRAQRRNLKTATARVKEVNTSATLSPEAEKVIIAAAEAGSKGEITVTLKLDKGLLEKHTNAKNMRVFTRTGLG